MDFLPNMGEYASYIWGSYAAAAIILIGMAVITVMSHKRKKAEAARLKPKRG